MRRRGVLLFYLAGGSGESEIRVLDNCFRQAEGSVKTRLCSDNVPIMFRYNMVLDTEVFRR